jgi:hypothetical protein
LALLGFVAALALVAAYLWSRPRSLGPDFAPISFATLVRDPSGGDALICPRSLCLRAEPDLEPPIFTSSAAAVMRALRQHARKRRDVDEVDRRRGGSYQLRLLQRSSVASAPLVIDILVDPVSSGAATVAMYARSLGRPDHARMLAELRRWLAAIGE